MAYRSDIALTMSHKLKDMILKKGRSRLTVDDYYMLKQLLNGSDADKFIENSKGIFFYMARTRWYPTHYPEIRLVEEFIDNNPDECLFMRVGEDFDDIVDTGNFTDVVNISLTQAIQFTETDSLGDSYGSSHIPSSAPE